MNQRAREVSNAKGEGNDGKSTHALPWAKETCLRKLQIDYRKDRVAEKTTDRL